MERKAMHFRYFLEILGFSENLEKSCFLLKNRSVQIGSGTVPLHPEHTYAAANDSQTAREPPARASSGGGRW